MSEPMSQVTHENIMSCVRTYVKYKNCNVRTFVTHEYEMFSVWFMLHTKMRSPNENIMSCARSFVTYEMCSVLTCGAHETFYVRTYVIHENMMFLGQNDDTYDTVRTYVTHESMMSFAQTYVTYENGLCSNIYYTRIWDVFCPNLCYVQKCNMLLTKRWCLVSELILHTNSRNVWSHVTHENMMSRVLTYVTYKLCNVRT